MHERSLDTTSSFVFLVGGKGTRHLEPLGYDAVVRLFACLSLVHGIRLDAGYVLSRNFDSLFVPKVAAGFGLDLDLLDSLSARMLQLGYAPVSGRSVLTWTFTRLLLMRGVPVSPPRCRRSPARTRPAPDCRAGRCPETGRAPAGPAGDLRRRPR